MSSDSVTRVSVEIAGSEISFETGRMAKQASGAVQGVEVVRSQTDALSGIGQINDSGVRILHSARALRKVAVGK